MAIDQARGRAEPGAQEGKTEQVVAQVQDKSLELKGQAAARVREQLDSRSSELGKQASSIAQALRRSAEQLETEGKTGPARLARQGAGQIDRLGGYLTGSDSDRFLHDIERFGRNRPWVAGGIGALLGFMGSRFLKASSDQRSQALRREQADSEAPLTRADDPGALRQPPAGTRSVG